MIQLRKIKTREGASTGKNWNSSSQIENQRCISASGFIMYRGKNSRNSIWFWRRNWQWRCKLLCRTMHHVSPLFILILLTLQIFFYECLDKICMLWQIFCAKCGSKDVTLSNDIILCDGACERGFHQFCLDPPLLIEHSNILIFKTMIIFYNFCLLWLMSYSSSFSLSFFM